VRLPPDGFGLRLLCLGAHSDDIEIGCGGTVLTWAQEGRLASVTWVVFSGIRERGDEARQSAEAFLGAVDRPEVQVFEFPDGYFPSHFVALKHEFEVLKLREQYDVVFTHARDDRHQDHRLVSDLTWNTWRDHLILEYEIPKYDGNLAAPNVFVAIDDATRRRKTALLMEHFPSQRGRQWFDEDTFNGIMRLRGLEINAPDRYAEAFVGRKVRL